MNKTRKISGLVWALLLAYGSADAAGLGKLTVQSTLGQPLRAEIELLSVTKEELADITARIASPEAFRQARIDRQSALGTLRFNVDQRANGQPVIRITSTASIPDPFLDMLIELTWSSGRLVREYTVLLDPPVSAKPVEVVRPATTPEVARDGAARSSAQPATEAAAEAPLVKPAAPAIAAPTPKRYGPIKSGETLRAIAGKLKPVDVSLEQMMVGLYQANPGAFQNNNMNRLNRGRVLNVPGAEAVRANTRTEAARTVHGHATEWYAYRRKLAEMAGEAAPAIGEEKAAGKIVAKEEAKPAPAAAAPKDVLKLSKGEPGTGGKADAKTQERMHAMEEELAAKGRALQEAQDRVSQLERTVRDMQKLLELKQQEALKPPPAQPAPSHAAPATPAEEKPAAPPPAEANQPKPAPVVAAPLPVAEPSSSWISTFISNPIYIGGIVAAILLSALLWMMMVGSRRRQGLTNFEDSIMTGGEFKNNAVFNASAGNAAAGTSTEGSMLLTDFSRLGMGAIDSHEVDPIAEAEVYMAYGRDAQAEEILREALVKDPSRHEIALKLLELYASRKDTTSFETTASELYAGTGGQNTPVWQRAAEMGRSIDQQNPLYRVAAPQSGSSLTPPATVSAVSAPVAAGFAATASPSELKPAQPPAAQAPADLGDLEELAGIGDWGDSSKTSGNDLDFSSTPAPDWGAPTTPKAAPAPEPLSAPVSERTSPQADDHSMEFDSAPEYQQPSIPVAEPAAELIAPEPSFGAPELVGQPETDELDLSSLDSFESEPELPEMAVGAHEEFDELALPPESDAALPETMPVLDLTGIDLELASEELPAADELSAPVADLIEEFVAEPVAEPESEQEVAPDFDQFAELAAADFEPAAESLPEPAFEAPSEASLAEAPSVESELIEAAPAGIDAELFEEVNTKLDLARAYLEMGDREGAHEILQEVIGEGDAQQKAEAEKLLAESA
ncbi:MAG: hypothetical protein B7Y41_12255 [Hydrogenophilales bacterium 28-61-23]|nr:MAG: hypothetical protein B7Y41_12255 [Hydrogenophilales bacterium 28-61-23]